MADAKILSPEILLHIAESLNLPLHSLIAVIGLLNEGGTVPFIALPQGSNRQPRRTPVDPPGGGSEPPRRAAFRPHCSPSSPQSRSFWSYVGVYGLLAYSVRQRTGEIGLRMALGSTRTDIARLILREGLSLLITGLCLDMVVAVAFAQSLRGFLYEVPPLDPLTFALVPALLFIAALAAYLIPRARAATTDPCAVRHE